MNNIAHQRRAEHSNIDERELLVEMQRLALPQMVGTVGDGDDHQRQVLQNLDYGIFNSRDFNYSKYRDPREHLRTEHALVVAIAQQIPIEPEKHHLGAQASNQQLVYSVELAPGDLYFKGF